MVDRLDSLGDSASAISLRRFGAGTRPRFKPGQRSVIFIHTVQVDEGLAAHLVRPNSLVGD